MEFDIKMNVKVKNTNGNELEACRVVIDQIDAQIIKLLSERKEVVEKVWEIKQQTEKGAYDEKRQEEVMQTRTQWGEELGLDTSFVKTIFDKMHDYYVRIQK